MFQWNSARPGIEGQNLFKDWFDSVGAGLTGQTPAWKQQEYMDKNAREAAASDRFLENYAKENKPTGDDKGSTYNGQDNYATGSGGGAWGTAQAGNPEEVAYWNDQLSHLDRILGSTNASKNQGLSRINSNYNQAVGDTNRAQEQTLRNYGIQRNDTNTAKVGALNRVDESARTGLQSLQRILGLSGAGNSAVANELVPHVVSEEATSGRSGIVDSFGTNLRNLGLAEEDANKQYESVLSDLGRQRNTAREDFTRGIDTQRQSIEQQRLDAASKKAMAGGQSYTQAAAARAPFQQNINQIQSSIDGLFNKYQNFTPTAKPVNVQDVNLKDYTFDPAAISGAQQGFAGNVASYLPWLQGREDDDRQRAF